MAVYTELSEEILRDFLSFYDLGAVQSFQGIAEGIENSNFLLVTEKGRYILTIFEKRMDPKELPWFIGLMEHLAKEGLDCPQPIKAKNGLMLQEILGKPALIVSFLEGSFLKEIDRASCESLGESLAKIHLLGGDYQEERKNRLDPAGWAVLLSQCTDDGEEKIADLIDFAKQELGSLQQEWPHKDALPRGQIHADLFPDNVFFENGKVSGLIDFYFACTDFYAYDLAICINAWCFIEERDFSFDYAQALIRGYEKYRPLSQEERDFLPILCRGASMRFLLTRLYDWVNTPKDAFVTRKDPWAYQRRLIAFKEKPYGR